MKPGSLIVIVMLAVSAACGGSSGGEKPTARVPSGFPSIAPSEAAHLRAFTTSADNMDPSLRPGDHFVANTAAAIVRGDIIVFLGPDSWKLDPAAKMEFVTRVIGVGGDHVACCDEHARVTVNGHALNEPYIHSGDHASDVPFDVDVPPGRLWVMGDNRSGSADSRAHLSDHEGTIPVASVIGVVTRIVMPPNRVRLFTPPPYGVG